MERATSRPTVSGFGDVEASVGALVRIDGYISQRHEAAGLYFKRADLYAENESCVLPEPFGDYHHGERVSMSGVLKRTGCATGRLICLNLCDDYVLVRGDVVSEEVQRIIEP